MLKESAATDYGEEVGCHLKALLSQLRESPELGLPPWCPREVLELERSGESEFESDDRNFLQRNHSKRILACAILLRNSAYVRSVQTLSDEELYIDTSANSVVQLTRSVVCFDMEACLFAIAFLRWLFEMVESPSLLPFIAYGIFVLAAKMKATDSKIVSDKDFSDLWYWLLTVESRCRQDLGHECESDRWLVGLNPYCIDSTKRLSDSIQTSIASRSKTQVTVKEKLALLSSLLGLVR